MKFSYRMGSYLGMIAISAMTMGTPQINQQDWKINQQTAIAQNYIDIEQLTFSSFAPVIRHLQKYHNPRYT